MAKTMHCGPLSRAFDLTRASVDEEARTIDIEFSSDAPVDRWFGREILDHSPASVRLDRLNNSAPFLLDHRSDSSDAVVGVIEPGTVKIENGRGLAQVRFSKSARAEEIFQDIKDGIRKKISFGYRVHAWDVTRGKNGEPDVYRATDWEGLEASLVPVPADDSVGIRSQAWGHRAAELSTNATITMDLDTPTATEDEQRTAPIVEAAPEQTRSAPAPAVIDPDAVRKAAIAEADRRDEIRSIATAHRIDEKLARSAIADGTAPDEFRAVVLRELEKMNPPVNQSREQDAPSLEPGTRAHTKATWAKSAANALADRGIEIAIPDYSQERDLPPRRYLDDEGNQFHRSMEGQYTLLDVAKLDAGIGFPIVDEALPRYRELQFFPVDVITGATVELTVRKDIPASEFRNANEGRKPIKGEYESRIFQTGIIEEFAKVDIQGVLNASRDPARVLFAGARDAMDSAMTHVAKETWYAGTSLSSDAKAPPGIYAQYQTGTDHEVDADGSTALTSVWVVELGVEALHHIYGNDTTLNFGPNWTEENVEDGAGGYYRALINSLSGRVATVLKNKNRAIRIKKVGTDSNKGLTDTVLAQAFERAENLGFSPNAIFMHSRSRLQLQTSRTQYHPTGAPVPIPVEYFGVPIVVTNNLSVAEGTV